MSYWAQIDEQNTVIQVLVGNDNDPDAGHSFFVNNFGGVWLQTSYNNNIRYNYAGVGYTYDALRDAFIAPKCHNEAVLDETTCRWTCNNADHDVTEL